MNFEDNLSRWIDCLDEACTLDDLSRLHNRLMKQVPAKDRRPFDDLIDRKMMIILKNSNIDLE